MKPARSSFIFIRERTRVNSFQRLHRGDTSRRVLRDRVPHLISASQTVPVYLPRRYVTLTRSFSRNFSPIALDRHGLRSYAHWRTFGLLQSIVRDSSPSRL